MRPAVATWIRVGVTLTAVAVAIALGIWAYRFYEYTPWTRDGRVRVYVVDTAPEVAGLVTDLFVKDNQQVHRGDLLFRIDPRDYDSAVAVAQANLDRDRAQLGMQREDLKRRQDASPEAVSAEERQRFATAVSASEAVLRADEATLNRAKLDRERCDVRSTVNGYVTNLIVRVGDYAQRGERTISVVDADSFFIYGYFQETQIRRIRPGAAVHCTLMGYGDRPLRGHVDSIGRGINDTSARPGGQGLPDVDPVFTWVRLAQRIPVRVHLDEVPADVILAAGQTCTLHVLESR